ncbi:MAG: ABC transporter permease [Acidobacteria bacterium]|nr:ABC transporter permease [Acidobacteriota bacterium]
MIDGVLGALAEPALLAIVALSFRVTGAALLLAIVVGVPLGAVVGLTRFPGKHLVTLVLYTGMGLPPVVVGLFVYILLSRSGPFGPLGWLFTPTAMTIAQTIIAFPLVAALTQTAVEAVDRDLRLQVHALGATRWQLGWTVLREARIGVTAAIVAAFGGIISEVGAVMLVGGNIDGHTRVLTTAIVLSTRQGDFALAMALGLVLLLLTLGANAVLLQLQGRSK